MYTRSKINPCKAKLLDLASVLESAGHAEKPISLLEATAAGYKMVFQEYKDNNILDIIVKQNTRETDVLADKHPEFVILNVSEVYHAKIKTNNTILYSYAL